MKIFGTPSISSIEFHFLEKYRFLDTYGKELVSLILEKNTNTQPLNLPGLLPFQFGSSAAITKTRPPKTGQILFDYPPDTNFVKRLGKSKLISLNPNFPNMPLNESATALRNLQKQIKSARSIVGIAHEYANTELIPLEKEAFVNTMAEKHACRGCLCTSKGLFRTAS